MKLEILVPLVTYPDASSDTIAPNAVAIARHLGGDLHALDIHVDIPSVSSALAGLLLKLPEMIRDAETKSRTRGQALLAAMKKSASKAGIALTTSEVAASPAEFGNVAAANARYYDLSLIGWELGNHAGRMTAEGLVFESGRPVVVLPDTVQVGVIDHVVIAWDGSRAAARAVADAQPFLQRASKITVVTVMDEKPIREKTIAARMAREMQKRGYPAKDRTINAEDCAISETLQGHAVEIGGQLLVMGGFGHSRLRDFVLGGATNGVLGNLRLLILLSH